MPKRKPRPVAPFWPFATRPPEDREGWASTPHEKDPAKRGPDRMGSRP